MRLEDYAFGHEVLTEFRASAAVPSGEDLHDPERLGALARVPLRQLLGRLLDSNFTTVSRRNYGEHFDETEVTVEGSCPLPLGSDAPVGTRLGWHAAADVHPREYPSDVTRAIRRLERTPVALTLECFDLRGNQRNQYIASLTTPDILQGRCRDVDSEGLGFDKYRVGILTAERMAARRALARQAVQEAVLLHQLDGALVPN